MTPQKLTTWIAKGELPKNATAQAFYLTGITARMYGRVLVLAFHSQKFRRLLIRMLSHGHGHYVAYQPKGHRRAAGIATDKVRRLLGSRAPAYTPEREERLWQRRRLRR